MHRSTTRSQMPLFCVAVATDRPGIDCEASGFNERDFMRSSAAAMTGANEQHRIARLCFKKHEAAQEARLWSAGLGKRCREPRSRSEGTWVGCVWWRSEPNCMCR